MRMSIREVVELYESEKSLLVVEAHRPLSGLHSIALIALESHNNRSSSTTDQPSNNRSSTTIDLPRTDCSPSNRESVDTRTPINPEPITTTSNGENVM
ncbi:hypothetical protein Syun_031113 [Stephania yunnanensis]|uniref:Uncharacterized protein n=1 Tax=Stephania yunnanensis TaxID=152371 RepID=A0AAP0DUM4_9MAGN